MTQRFAQFQGHYGFAQDFCNPASGNEKGNVEANNKHFKNKIKSQIALNNMSFINLETFRDFIWKICREHNEDSSVQEKLRGENLLPLPDYPFRSFSTEIVRISKYSLFSIGTSGHLYSVPSQYIGLSLEARLYPSLIEVVGTSGDIICSHKRLVGVKGLVSIKIEHVIDGLLKKPGAFRYWKYRDVVFERPSWNRFHSKLMESGKNEKEFLKCISLLKEFGREDVTLAMELAMENKMELESSTLRKIISNDYKNVLLIPDVPVNLDQYDFFLKGDNIHELRAEHAGGS